MLLDTLRMQRRLREAGFPDEQADILTEEIANIVTGELATKADLRELRTEMMSKFAEVRGEIAEVRGEIAEVRGEIAEVRGEIAEVRGEIAEVKAEVAKLTNSIADFKTGIVKWVVGLVAAMLLGGAGMTIAVVVTLIRVLS